MREHNAVAHGVAAGQRFSSLRLSVRTPPFHGGESGSIPLGSAIYFNGLAPGKITTSNECPYAPVDITRRVHPFARWTVGTNRQIRLPIVYVGVRVFMTVGDSHQ